MAFEIMKTMEVDRSRNIYQLKDTTQEDQGLVPVGPALLIQMMNIVGDIQNGLTEGVTEEVILLKGQQVGAELAAQIQVARDGVTHTQESIAIAKASLEAFSEQYNALSTLSDEELPGAAAVLSNNLNATVEPIRDFAPGVVDGMIRTGMMKELLELLTAIREGNRDPLGYPIALIFMLLSKDVIERAEVQMNRLAEILATLSDVLSDINQILEMIREIQRLSTPTGNPGGPGLGVPGPGIPPAEAERITANLRATLTRLIGPEGGANGWSWSADKKSIIPGEGSTLHKFMTALRADGRNAETDPVARALNNFFTGSSNNTPNGDGRRDTTYPGYHPDKGFLETLTDRNNAGSPSVSYRWIAVIGHNWALEQRDGAGKGGTNYAKNFLDLLTPAQSSAGSASQTFQMFMTQKSNDVQTFNDIARSAQDDQSRFASTAIGNLRN